MKKITTIIAASLLLFSCTKENIAPQKSLGGNIISTVKINPSTTETRYRNSDLVVYETDLGAGESFIKIEKGNKKDFVKAKVENFDSYRKLSVKTLTGKEIYFLKVNKDGGVMDFKFNNTEQLVTVSFSACMSGLASECSKSWSCSVICGAALAACSLGWSVGCAASKIVN